MKRPGFYIPTIVIFVVLVMLVMGSLLEKTASRVSLVVPAIHARRPVEAARRGLKQAEDWLMSAVLSGEFPTGRNLDSLDPFESAKAVLVNGKSAEWDERLPSSVEVKLYVADTAYKEGLFVEKMADNAWMPIIPRIPPVDTENAALRFYYLRSEATDGTGQVMSSEELLAVSRDKSSGAVEVTRLFHRAGSFSR
ncbi:MAG: hypothetical protein LBQ36_00160 [Synergistaceae bacterium]|nr:hypothetical protein [Synergistaceae bacterium]